MAVVDQPLTTYENTLVHERVVANVIKIIDPIDTPLIAALGGLDAARGKFGVRQNGYKIEILEDQYDPLSGALNNGTTVATDATTFTVADASIFRDGHVIKIDDEYMVVKDANASTNVVTVYSRSYGGTNSTHAATATVEIVGMARLEGDDADFSGLVEVTAPYNYTSIFQDSLKVSGTMQAIDQIAIPDAYEYQAKKKIPGLLRQIELAAFHGVRSAGSESAPRSFGSLNTFITDNTVTASSGKVTKTIVDDLSEAIYLDGGNPDLFVCNPTTARDLRDVLDSSSFVRLTQENDQFGMKAIEAIQTQYHMLKIVMTRFCPKTTAYMLDSKRVGLYTLRPFAWKELAVVGDSRRGEVVGEFSLLVANDKAHGKIIAIST